MQQLRRKRTIPGLGHGGRNREMNRAEGHLEAFGV